MQWNEMYDFFLRFRGTLLATEIHQRRARKSFLRGQTHTHTHTDRIGRVVCIVREQGRATTLKPSLHAGRGDYVSALHTRLPCSSWFSCKQHESENYADLVEGQRWRCVTSVVVAAVVKREIIISIFWFYFRAHPTYVRLIVRVRARTDRSTTPEAYPASHFCAAKTKRQKRTIETHKREKQIRERGRERERDV